MPRCGSFQVSMKINEAALTLCAALSWGKGIRILTMPRSIDDSGSIVVMYRGQRPHRNGSSKVPYSFSSPLLSGACTSTNSKRRGKCSRRELRRR
mmetsp:Transcript_71599/g.186255  ORF Transcript_71599/g.186255 Transcript_71599/m.186255 type:complete len:95 (+) Transcript_71599:15-299(+)